jgi:hypothetical protein
MNRGGLIVLQAVGALSILPYPFVLLANVMSMAAPGHTSASTTFWLLLCLYPLGWVALYVLSWRAMAHGAVGLAFGLSSIPALACLLVAGFFLYGWAGFMLGSAGIGNGGLHVTTYPNNPVLDSIALATEDVQLPPGPQATMEKALHEIDANPALVNVSIPGRGSPLNVAVSALIVSLDGTITGDPQRQQDRVRLVRALVAHGGHLSADEATDLRKTWVLRRALYDGPVATATENPLVWRIVTHDRGPTKPFNPFTDKIPERSDTPPPFLLKESDIPLLSRATGLHGTPLYAALLDNANDVCAVIIKAGGRLSADEERDPAASAALQAVFERAPDLRSAYHSTR